MADAIRKFGGEVLYPFCGESEENRQRTLHCCRNCWSVWPCSQLKRINKKLVCPLCQDAAKTGSAYERTTLDTPEEGPETGLPVSKSNKLKLIRYQLTLVILHVTDRNIAEDGG